MKRPRSVVNSRWRGELADTVLLGTDDGILFFQVDGMTATLEMHTFLGTHVVALAPADHSILVACSRNGLGRIDLSDWSTDWVLDAHVLSVLTHPSSRKACLAGTEPAALYRSDNGGRNWRELRQVRDAPEATRWYHPSQSTSPRVLALAWDVADVDTFYCGIEVGGVLKTVDGGETFRQMNKGLHEDIHKLVIHPKRPRELWAVTGSGLYKSDNGAESWQSSSHGMRRRYAVALAVAPGTVETLVVSAAQGPPWNGTFDANAMFFRSTSRGVLWEVAMQGLPQSLDGVPVALMPSLEISGRIYGAVASGELLASDNTGRSWRLLAADLPAIQAAVCLPPDFPGAFLEVTQGSAEMLGPESAAGAQHIP